MRSSSIRATLACLASLAALAAPGPLTAQWKEVILPKEGEEVQVVAPASKARPETYGTTAITYVSIPAAAMVPLDSTEGYITTSSGYHDTVTRKPAAGSAPMFFSAPVNLPSGAKVVYVELDYCDTNPAINDIQGAFVDCQFDGTDCNATSFVTSGGVVGGDTCTYANKDVSADNIVIDNFRRHYSVVSLVFNDDGSNGVSGMIVGYRLQVSPAPATATFADVPTSHLYFRAIEALVHAGITSGCGSGNFCPDQPVTRGELAKFLANALGLHWEP